jgi:hypothetical protein
MAVYRFPNGGQARTIHDEYGCYAMLLFLLIGSGYLVYLQQKETVGARKQY